MAPDEGIEPPQAVLETAVIPLDQSGIKQIGVPTGIRTPVAAVKGRRPRPLDDGDLDKNKMIVAPHTANYRDMSYSTYLTSRILPISVIR